MDKYQDVPESEIWSGSFGVVKRMRNRQTGVIVAVKFIKRASQNEGDVDREITNHRPLQHPNIIKFIETIRTEEHHVIVMEYAEGGELFSRIGLVERFNEDEARYFFQQLICGVSYCHSKDICHRDLKLENVLLDRNLLPRLKICDFGFSKSSVLHSRPNSKVGSPEYIAPEVLTSGPLAGYDGKLADVWSSGVALYVMLAGAYPFQDQGDPTNIVETVQRIKAVDYKIPDYVLISADCRQLISRIFVSNPMKRITMKEIKSHAWFLRNLPRELTEEAQSALAGP